MNSDYESLARCTSNLKSRFIHQTAGMPVSVYWGTALVACTVPATLYARQHYQPKNDEEGTAVPSPRAIGEEEDDHGQREKEDRQDQRKPIHRAPPLEMKA